MDASAIAEITSLSEKHVESVLRGLKDSSQIEHAVEQYLESKSGPFKEGASDGWAESGKSRRPKKVRAIGTPTKLG